MRDRGFGWDLPPGVNLNDIPGNRPEDEAEEAFWSAFEKKLDEEDIRAFVIKDGPPIIIGIDVFFDNDVLQKIICIARDLGFNHGYGMGQNDMGMELSSRMLDEQEVIDGEAVEAEPLFPDAVVTLSGEDGNAMMIVGLTKRALKKARVNPTAIRQYEDEAKSGDYEHVLATTMKWVTVE